MAKSKKAKSTTSRPTAPTTVVKQAAPNSAKTPKHQAEVASMTNRPTYRIVGLLAAALGAVIYLNTVGHQYTLDDFSIIVENWVTKGGLKNLGTIFSTEYRFGSWNSVGSLFRPVPLTMFAFEWQMAPDNPALGHWINIFTYSLLGWVLWITFRRVLADYPPILPALAVLLFIAHPIHTEVVANIKSRDEMLSLLGPLAAIYGVWRYLENKNIRWLLAALFFFAIGQFSKEGAITFLAIIPLTLWFFTKKTVGEIIRISALFLIPAVIFLLIRHRVLSSQEGAETFSILDNFIVGAKNPADRLASALMMCGKYLQMLVFPHPLVHELGYSQLKPISFGDWRPLVSLLLYGGMLGWALWQLPKRHILSYAILFYLITFSLFSNVLITIGTSYGERLLFTPSFGYTLALAWFIFKVFKLQNTSELWQLGSKGTMAWTVAGAIILAYSLKTVIRNPAWYDSNSLYTADIQNAPNSAKMNYHYGLELVKQGMDDAGDKVTDRALVEKGMARYSRAIEIFPEYHDAYGSRGVAYFRLGDMDKALADYQMCLKYRPNDAKALSNMGFIYFARNDLANAEKVYRESIKWDPRFIDARRNLGAVLAINKRFPEAIEQWQEALKYEPQNPTLLQYIGSAYRDMGQPEKAQPWLERAERAKLATPKKR